MLLIPDQLKELTFTEWAITTTQNREECGKGRWKQTSGRGIQVKSDKKQNTCKNIKY